MLTRKATLLAKKETTYGTDAIPVAGDAVLCKDIEVKALGEELVRNYLRSSLSPLPHEIGVRWAEVKFTTELKGSGSLGVAPEIGPLFQAAGFAETVVALTSVSYDPSSAAFSSATIYVYRDGILHKITGARGTFEVNLNVGKYGEITWTFTGIYNTITDTALIAGIYDSTLPPLCLGASFSIKAYAFAATKLAFSMANILAMRKSINAAAGLVGVEITGWDDRGGSFDPEAVLEATHTFFADWIAGTQSALTATIGSVGNNRCVITGPKVQYKSISPGDRDGVYVYEVPFRLAQNAGDDEVKFFFA